MFLIDTNVISESRKIRSGRVAPEFVAWLEATRPSSTFLSAMSLFELELGVARVERGDPAQGEILRRWLDHTVKPGFADACWRWTAQSQPLAPCCMCQIRLANAMAGLQRQRWFMA